MNNNRIGTGTFDNIVETLYTTPEDAQLIMISLSNTTESFSFLRPFLLRVGVCLVLDKARNIPVNEESLWFLSNKINPQAKVGGTRGFDLLKKIYQVLLKFHPEIPLLEFQDFEALFEATEKEETDAEDNGDAHEGTNEDTHEGTASTSNPAES